MRRAFLAFLFLITAGLTPSAQAEIPAGNATFTLLASKQDSIAACSSKWYSQSELRSSPYWEVNVLSWLPQDKADHFWFSAAFASSGYLTLRTAHNDSQVALVFSLSSVILLGALKEFYDARHPERHQASWWDFTAGVLGATAGAIIASAIGP